MQNSANRVLELRSFASLNHIQPNTLLEIFNSLTLIVLSIFKVTLLRRIQFARPQLNTARLGYLFLAGW